MLFFVAHPCKHLLLDGYNILHAWPKKENVWDGGLDVARDRLGETVRVLHDQLGLRVSLVFDGKGAEIEVERPSHDLTFSYIFTPRGVTADTIIEQLVSTAARPSELWVVSRDNGVRETVLTLGGYCLTPQELFDWVDSIYAHQSQDLSRRRKESEKEWGQRLFSPKR